MALDAEAVADKIRSSMQNAGFIHTNDTTELENIKDLWQIVAHEILTYIQNEAEVTVAAGIEVDTDNDGTADGVTITDGEGTISWSTP